MNHFSKLGAAMLASASLMVLAMNATAAGDLTKDQVKAKVEAAGYSNVTDIRREKNHFDAKAMKDGKAVSLDVDAKTGAITPENEGSEKAEHEGKSGY